MAVTGTKKGGGTALQAPYTFSFMRRGKSTPSSAAGVAAAAAAVAKEDEQQQQQQQQSSSSAAAASPPAKASSGAASSLGEGGVGGGGEAAAGDAATTAAAAGAGGGIAHPYENSIKTIATVTTVEEFWQVYDYLKRPSDLPTTTDYHLFRSGIKPTWEDPGNARGGKWIVRLPKGLASRYWEEIVLALVGGQLAAPAPPSMSSGVSTGGNPSLLPDGEICGAVLSIRYSEDILALWNRTADDRIMVERIRDAVKKCLQLPPHANMEYKPHQTSIQDRSSFRNTSSSHVWKPKSVISAVEGPPQRSISVGGVVKAVEAASSGAGGIGNLNTGTGSAHEPTTLAASSSSVGSGAGSEHSGGGGGGTGQPMSRRSNSWGEERKPTKRSDGPRWRPT